MAEELTREEKMAKLADRERAGKQFREASDVAEREAAALRKELGIEGNGGGSGSGGGTVTTLEAFQKLSSVERTQFYRDHPEQYSKFMEQIRTKSERDLFNKGVAPL